MDAKITKTRLSRMLSYDWLKIVGFAVAFIAAWVLIFTVTATKVMPSQQFKVCNFTGNVTDTKGDFNKYLSSYIDKNFTHEVIETSVFDMTDDETVGWTVLQARASTNELDAMLVSQLYDPNSEYVENGETKYERTHMQTFVRSYHFALFSFEGENNYFAQMEKYLNGYYTQGYQNAESLDKAKVEQDFRARVKKNKDKRYKTETQIAAGIEGEIDRMVKYRQALLDFNEYLEKGYVRLEKSSYTAEDKEDATFTYEGTYAINICPETTKDGVEGKLSQRLGYLVTQADGSYAVSAKNMCVCLFDSNGDEECYRYEGLVFITNLVKDAL